MKTSEKTIKEHDIVVLNEDLAYVKSGSIGAVVHIYPDSGVFEVEFLKSDGKPSVETVSLGQITKL